MNGAPSEAPLFRLRNVSKVYGTGAAQVVALRAVDLDVARGEFVVLLGASGGGKSTLLNLLGGLDVPTSGLLEYAGCDMARLGDTGLTAFRRAAIGFVFQFYNLVPSLTALENVELVTEISARPMAPEAALRLVGLGDRLHHFPAQLSGGEQQRVAIARAGAKNPAVLLCDEPTGALDAATGQMVLAAIEQVHRELGTTVILITHNAAIAGMADRVIHLSSGQITGIETHATRLRPDEVAW